MQCFNCKKGELKVVDGWESKKALECDHCGNYYYWVGNIFCCGCCDSYPTKDQQKEMKKILGYDKPRIEKELIFKNAQKAMSNKAFNLTKTEGRVDG